MNANDLKHLKTWFADYVATFYADDQDANLALNIKADHTLRVCENAVMIGTKLGMSPHDWTQ